MSPTAFIFLLMSFFYSPQISLLKNFRLSRRLFPKLTRPSRDWITQHKPQFDFEVYLKKPRWGKKARRWNVQLRTNEIF